MKKISLFFLLAVIIHCIAGADVKVLSIGVSNYPENSGWRKINSHNDVKLMKSTFPDAVTIEDNFACHSDISRQLRRLTDRANTGDTVIVHFSGHGQQIITKMSDKETDGVDEALVPYDAAKRKSDSYAGAKHYTDDEFGINITALRKKVGKTGLVIAVIDACHSDSMDKDVDDNKEIYRGTNEIFGAESLPESRIEELKKKYHLQDDSPIEKSDKMSNVIFISACRSDQRNYEIVKDGTSFGSLTYFFTCAVREKGIQNVSNILTAVYDGMSSDKSLKFHGQLPAIRNTIGWKEPEVKQVIINTPQNVNTSDEAFPHAGLILTISTGIVIFLLALWIMKRK